ARLNVPRSSIEPSPHPGSRLRATPSAPTAHWLSAHPPSSARRGILEEVREKNLVRTLINSGDTGNYQRRRTANVNAGRESRTAAAGNTAATGGSVHDEKFLFRSKVLDG